jgi:hypothetical protein
MEYLIIKTIKTMKPVLAYENNFYPYNGQFIPQGGDNVFLDFEIDGNRFFLVKFRTIDLANNQIILSIVKL